MVVFVSLCCCILFFFMIYRYNGFTDFWKKLSLILQPIIIGVVIAYLLNPIMKFLEGHLLKFLEPRMKSKRKAKKTSRGIAITGSLVFLVGICVLLVAAIVPSISASIQSMITSFPQEAKDLTKWVDEVTNGDTELASMIQQGVDAIALATESDNSMLPYLRAAAEADIPVFLFNMTELDKDNIYYVSSIGYDQYNAGLEIGKYVAEHYGDKEVKLAILEGYAGIVNTMRIDGFKEGIQGKDNIKIVASQTADWTREKGQSVTESILTSNPDINLIFGDYDEMVLGGLVSIKERGLLDQIDTIGYGCTKDGVAAIENNEMTATIDVGEYGTGIDIIDAVNDFCIEGKSVEKVINRPSKVYDKNNIGELDRVIFE